jgi:hypothetical protein
MLWKVRENFSSNSVVSDLKRQATVTAIRWMRCIATNTSSESLGLANPDGSVAQTIDCATGRVPHLSKCKNLLKITRDRVGGKILQIDDYCVQVLYCTIRFECYL